MSALQQPHAAVDALRRSLVLQENQPKVHYQLCALLYRLNLPAAALPHARWLLAHADESSHCIHAGYVLRKVGLHDEALAAFMRALELAPHDAQTVAVALQAAQHGCDWALAEQLMERLQQEFYAVGRGAESYELHFVHVAWCMNEAWNAQMLQGGARRAMALAGVGAGAQPSMAFDHRQRQQHLPRGGRLRVGYLSADFCNHAVLHLIAGVLAAHDRSVVEVFAYDHSPPDTSYFRQRFEASVEHLVDIRPMTDAQAAQRIYADQIDVLVDLQGFTEGHRLPIFALRPAPVQVTYLGFPGSSGMEAMDYVLCDATVTPDSSRPHYTEKLCRLPETYQSNDNQRIVASNPMERSACGLPAQGVVFCSFNQSYKIDRVTFETWMEVLRAVAGSVVWLLDPGTVAARNLRQAAQAAGVAPERVVFAPKLPAPLHLARLALADVCLDTRVYNGHTITADALWVGTPVVTAPGSHFASRVAASVLKACGLPELIAADMPGMARLAIALGNDPAQLAALKEKLRRQRFMAPLFDTERMARHLERAYRLMAERARQGLAPDHIDVPALAPRTAPFMAQLPTRDTVAQHSPGELAALLQPGRGLQWPQSQCPLCQHGQADAVREAAWPAPVGDVEQAAWLQCQACQHVYSSAFWSQAGQACLPVRPWAVAGGGAAAAERARYAPLVSQVLAQLAGASGLGAVLESKEATRWMDVYADTPWLYTAALEYGCAMTGIVRHTGDGAWLKALGGVVAQVNFLNVNINGQADVVSLMGCLEQVAFPPMLLERVTQVLRPGGVLLVGFANVDSVLWRLQEQQAAEQSAQSAQHQPSQEPRSALWQEVDRLHLFSLVRLTRWLQARQFRVVQVLPDTGADCAMVLMAVKEAGL